MTETAVGEIAIEVDAGRIVGDLEAPSSASGIVVFAHGSGSSRHSQRNRQVASVLRGAGLGTLLLDLLTDAEESVDVRTHHLRFDIDLLAGRVAAAVDWLRAETTTAQQPIGLFGASTGAAAALVAAAERPRTIRAIVSRGGRPDLAGDALARVRAPTLLIVGGADDDVLTMNEDARAAMTADVRLEVVPGATHLFEEPGALEQVAELAAGHLADHVR
jgi:dienelactone hydrolase